MKKSVLYILIFVLIISSTNTAINANFFDAYSSLEPIGSIMKNKKLTYLEGTNTSFMITGKNKVSMDYFKTTIKGYLNGETNVTVEEKGINLNAVDHMISAGPFLVNNGVVI